MKRTFITYILLFVGVCVFAQAPVAYAPAAVQAYSHDAATGLYYVSSADKTAVIVTSQDTKSSGAQKPYSVSPMVIPVYFLQQVTGFEGSRVDTIRVIELGEYALMKATFTSLTFGEPSNITIFRSNAMKDVNKISGTLTLPSSLEQLETNAICGSAMQITKLVIPASLTNLAVSAVLLPNLQEIEFLGSVPPVCDIVGGYNPWTSATIVTSADIKVTVPDGALSAYQDAEGIGDYFTCLKKEDPTSVDVTNLQNGAIRKVFRGGHLFIQRDSQLFNAQGHKVQYLKD